MEEPVVRRAVGQDLPRIMELFEQVDELHREALPWLFRKLEQPRSQELLHGFVDGPDRAAFVATDSAGGRLKGALFIMIREAAKAPIVRPARVAEIDSLVVDVAARRQGVGRALTRAALHWSEAAQATRTELGVYEFNDGARAFWESMGFATVFRRLCRHQSD